MLILDVANWTPSKYRKCVMTHSLHIHVFCPTQDWSVWLGLTSREQLMSPECSKHQVLSLAKICLQQSSCNSNFCNSKNYLEWRNLLVPSDFPIKLSHQDSYNSNSDYSKTYLNRSRPFSYFWSYILKLRKKVLHRVLF